MRAKVDGERNGRLERDRGRERFRGSGEVQGECASFQPGHLDGWSVNREGGRTGRAGQEFHMQDDINLPSLVWPTLSISQMGKVRPKEVQ